MEGAEEEPATAVEGETKTPRRSKRITKKKALKKENSNKAASFMLKNFRKKGITFLKKMTEKQFEEFITFADNQYYIQNKPIMTDEEYDVVREFAENKFKDNEIINFPSFKQEDYYSLNLIRKYLKKKNSFLSKIKRKFNIFFEL